MGREWTIVLLENMIEDLEKAFYKSGIDISDLMDLYKYIDDISEDLGRPETSEIDLYANRNARNGIYANITLAIMVYNRIKP